MILGIFGAGSLGKEVYEIAERINDIDSLWEEIVFVDNFYDDKTFYDVVVWRLDALLESIGSDVKFVIAAGEPKIRKEIYDQLLANNCSLTNLIDPTAIISKTAELGQGIIVTPYSTISCNVKLEDNVLIQSNIRVGHDICAGKHSVISANCAIGGATKIGEQVFVGMNATIKGDLVIGDSAIVSMGAVVFKDVAEGLLVAGNPARATLGNANHTVFSK